MLTCSRCKAVVSERNVGTCPICLGQLRPVGYVSARRRKRRRTRKAEARRGGRRSVYTSDEPGYPLGRGFPLGETLREDGESHRQAWMRVVRADPCSYCGGEAGTVDHIEPKDPRVPCRGLGGLHTWLNFTAACNRCNSNKGSRDLLPFLLSRC